MKDEIEKKEKKEFKKVEVKYPRWVYHQEKAPEGVLVNNKIEHDKLGVDGWVGSPAKFKKDEDKKVNDKK